MKDAQNRGVIRHGDSTSHGGQVISASDTFTVFGKAVALDGDMTFCPKCKDKFPIVVADGDRQHHGKRVVYQGDSAACGATLNSSN